MNGQKKKKVKTMRESTKKSIIAWTCGIVTCMAIIMYVIALLYAFFG